MVRIFFLICRLIPSCCVLIWERRREGKREKGEGRKEEREEKGGGREKSTASTHISSNKDTNPIMTSSKPSHLPEAPPPSTNMLEDRAPIYEFGGIRFIS